MTGALLDTSGTELDLPETAAISVVSLGELHAGVELARDDVPRAMRARRLAAVRAAFRPIDVDERIVESYGRILAAARREGRTVKATDLLIIATALATGRTLVTRDDRQAKLARAVGQPVGVP